MNCISTSTVTTKKQFCKAECENAGYYYGGKSSKGGYYTGVTETKSSKSANLYEKVCNEQIIIASKSGKSVGEVVSVPPPAPVPEPTPIDEIVTPAPQIDVVVTYEPTIITTTGSTPTVATSSEYDGVEIGDRNPQ